MAITTEMNESNTRTISLIVTERCNLSCVYCYEHNKSASDMTFDRAKQIIDRELIYGKPKENTYIEFFGGEPFLNFDLIKQVYDYVMSFYKGKIRFFATTNGTLVHGDIAEWLSARKNFSVGLSLDGNRVAHNLNRSDSFDKIDLAFFLKNYPEQPIKMTVSELSMPYFSESVKYLTSLGFTVACNLAYMVDWLSESNVKTLAEQLNDLISWYADDPNIKKCSMLDFKIERLAYDTQSNEKIKKYCGTGTAMVCYDMRGTAYPCQLFAPISAGSKAITTEQANIHDELDIDLLDRECADCYYLKICPFCLGSNYLSCGDLYKPDKARCKLYKMIFAANAKLKAIEWARGTLKCDKDTEQALLRSIVHIQNLQ